MKHSIKTVLLQATFAGSLALFASCDNGQRSSDAKEVAEDRNEEKFDSNKQQNDAQFLVNAAEMNMKEIQLGQLAQQKGASAEVKQLGKMMEDAHTKSLNELKALAQSKRISVPTSASDKTRDAYNDLNDKSAEDFDKAYADRMVSEHEDSIDLFEDAAEDSHDTEIRNWASASLTALRTHLDHSKAFQKQLEDRNGNQIQNRNQTQNRSQNQNN